MKILVTGGSGMLGYNLLRQASRQHAVWGSYHTREMRMEGCQMFPLDLTSAERTKANIISIGPEVFVHTAALTDVDECEREPERARKINAEGTAVLAEIAEELGARFVYISTDYVFDGVKGDYSEDDSPHPVNSYGATKLAGEDAVRQRCSNALILRTSIFGFKIPPTTGLMETLVNSLLNGQSITRFADQFATPIYVGQLSGLILKLLETDVSGLFHAGGGEKLTRFEFAKYVAELFSLDSAKIQPVPFRQIDGLAPRPRDSSLVSGRLRDLLGVQLPGIKHGMERLMADWKNSTEGKTGK